MSVPLLLTREVVAGYAPRVDILAGVSIEVGPGEIVTVVGPNGAGKSTLIKAICGLLPPRSGDIELDGEPITGLPPHEIARCGVGYVPQLQNVFPSLTVHENLEVSWSGRGDATERLERMYALFPRLRERRRQQAGTMSGGERQLVAMARALVAQPRLLLLDEPSAGLAPAMIDAIFEQVLRINEAGVTVVMVEQNARRALAMSTRGYVLDAGRNAFEGTGEELLDNERVAELYLGGTDRLDARAGNGV